MARPVRFGLTLKGRELEPVRDGCAWISRDGVLESLEGSSTCPPEHAGGPRTLLLPPAAIAHAHSADRLFPEYGVDRPLHALVAPPSGEKHRRLARLSREQLVDSALTYYREAERAGAGLVADFRELGGLGCETAREAARQLKWLRVVVLGRPGPRFPKGCDGLGLSSPLDYSERELEELSSSFRLRAVHVAETPATRLAGDLEIALRAGFNILVHGTHLSRRDLEIAAASGVSLVVCAGSNMWHGTGIPPIRLAIEEGIRIGIGTDNAAWNPPDIWGEARLALLVARLQGGKSALVARRILESLLVDGYEMYGFEPPLICEGCPAAEALLLEDEWGVLDAEEPYSAIVKRVRPGGLRVGEIL